MFILMIEVMGMKKLLGFAVGITGTLLSSPVVAMAAETTGEAATGSVPLWLCIPFVCLLLCIAVFRLPTGATVFSEQQRDEAATRGNRAF